MTIPVGKSAEVMDVRSWCRSFPALPAHPIERLNLLGDLEDAFVGGTQVIVLEGEDGKGKTTLLAQFALRHPLHTIALFARPTSSLTYDPRYLLTDLCEQLHWLVYKTPRTETETPPDEGEYRVLLTRLEGRAIHARQPYYFLVDGLEEIPSGDAIMRDQLLALVQFGLKSFHFLYAGHPGALGRLPQRVRQGIEAMQFPLPRFTLDETESYLADVGFSEGDIRQMFELTRGLPGYLAVVRRVLIDGLPVERLMSDLPTELSGLFDIQWDAVGTAGPEDAELLVDLLAFLAHDRGYHTVGSLARLTDSTIHRVEGLLKPLSFLRLGQSRAANDDKQQTAVNIEIGSQGGISTDTLVTAQGRQSSESLALYEVAFVPEAFRIYAARRLASRSDWVRNRIASDLSTRPLSPEALTQLPATLAELNRVDELMRYLSPDYFAELVAHQRPLSQALATSERGLQLAAGDQRDVSLVQLSLTRALLLELGRGGVSTEEIEAYLALGDEDRALALALSAPLVEDRLELLATIAKVRRVNGQHISPVLHNQIEQLAIQVDPEALGERARNLGLTLLFSLPAMGLRFLEHSEEDKLGDQGNSIRHALVEADPDLRDWLDAAGDAFGEGRDRAESQETYEALRASLSESATGRLSMVLSALYGQQSAEDVLKTLHDIPEPQDQIFVLGQWLRRNATSIDAPRMVDEAIDRILHHSGITMPDAQIFREIAEPLPQLENLNEAERLVGRFDTLADLIERQSPSRDYVRLQVWLTRAECRYDPDRASNRLLQTWFYACDRADLVNRAACVALVVAALDPLAAAAQAAGMRSPLSTEDEAEIKSSLDPLIEDLLATCADQYHATRGVIRALAPRHPQRALDLAVRLNTRNRRLAATLDVLRISIRGIRPDTIAQITDTLDRGLGLLVGSVRGDVVLLWIAESVAALVGASESRHKRDVQDASPNEDELTAVARLLPYWEMCRDMAGARRRCRALALWEIALRHLMIRWGNMPSPGMRVVPEENGEKESVAESAERVAESDSDSSSLVARTDSPLVDTIKVHPTGLPRGPITSKRLPQLVDQTTKLVDAAWGMMDPGWRRVTLGFELAHLLAPDNSDRARQFLRHAEQQSRDLKIPAAHVVGPYTECLSLAVRAYAGLLDLGLQTEQDRIQLSRIVEMLPSYAERVAVWADVAVRCFFHQQEALGREIVVTQIHRLLELISPQDTMLLRWAITQAASALYLAHQETARDWIERVAPENRAPIYAEIVRVYITRCPPSDPFNLQAGECRALSYPEALDVCRLMQGIDHDGYLYNAVVLLADSINAGRPSGTLSREHQRQIAERARRIIEKHLPDPRNIQHEGYKLIALAQVARMDATTANQRNTWVPLAEAARNIPNASDRAFVLAHLAATTPSLEDRNAWLDEAEAVIAVLPARLNRLESYAALAQLVLDARWGEGGASKARGWLRKAMEVAAEDPRDASMYSAQRHLIDLAYQFDEPLARDLAKQIDDDPARLAQRLQALELKKQLADATSVTSPSGDTRSRLLGRSMSKADSHGEPERQVKRAEEVDAEERLYALVEACMMHLAALDSGRLPTVPIERMRDPLEAAARLPLSEAFPIYMWAIENLVRRLSRVDMQVRKTLHPLFEAVAQVAELAPRLEEDANARAERAARAAARMSSDTDELHHSIQIGPGQRDKAEQVLRDWCRAHPSPTLIISDRYFTPNDLRWVRVLTETMPAGCRITVLTSRRGQMQAHVASPWEQTYKLHWRLTIQEGEPPPIEIVILGTINSGQAPFHDRRIIAAGAGLQIGVSFNALGGASDTIINHLTADQVEDTERDLDTWARGGAWEYKGERLLRKVFRLDDPDV